MIEGGLSYVWTAYAVAVVGLLGLTLVVALRARHWAQRVRVLERKTP